MHGLYCDWNHVNPIYIHKKKFNTHQIEQIDIGDGPHPLVLRQSDNNHRIADDSQQEDYHVQRDDQLGLEDSHAGLHIDAAAGSRAGGKDDGSVSREYGFARISGASPIGGIHVHICHVFRDVFFVGVLHRLVVDARGC